MVIAITSILTVILVILLARTLRKKDSKSIKEMKGVASIGERTTFIIPHAESDAERKIETWLQSNGWKKKHGWYSWHHSKDGVIYRFGFSFSREEDGVVIQSWLGKPGKEQPLVTKLYQGDFPITAPNSDEVKAEVEAEGLKYEDVLIAVGQRGKDVYIEMLRSLLEFDQDIREKNSVKFKGQKKSARI